MYQKSKSRSWFPNNNYRKYRIYGRGGRSQRITSFDPTALINTYSQSINTTDEKIEIINSFADFKISSTLKTNISAKGYTTPTPIQDKAIPAILEGHDVIGIANTGTGKTAAFLIPLIEKISINRNEKVLIVTPTRELANQIEDQLYYFSKNVNINSALCIGGVNIKRQISKLQRNANFVIGTPGRLMDLIRNNYLNLSTFRTVVLDETDRMVDIGFIKDIKYIISLLPKNRQSLFFSATIGIKVREILQSFVQDPVLVSVSTRQTSRNITQNVIRVSNPGMKVNKLHEILNQKESEKVLIFGRTKRGIQRLSIELNSRGFYSGTIHGNKSQNQRNKVLDQFKKDEIRILIATDVASRGLDIPNVSHVINYDLPESHDAYIHRIGRTGRADKKGVALSFVG